WRLRSPAHTRRNTADTCVWLRDAEQRVLPRTVRRAYEPGSSATCVVEAGCPQAPRHPACAEWRPRRPLDREPPWPSRATWLRRRRRFGTTIATQATHQNAHRTTCAADAHLGFVWFHARPCNDILTLCQSDHSD